MKTLKFRSGLCEQIMAGTKTATWRLLDDKDLQEGDSLEFMNWETREVFGAGSITALRIKTLGSLEESDWEGHEQFASEGEMYATYRTYYGDAVGPETEVKIIDFSFSPDVVNK
jgi:hypothetical protein